MPAIVACPNCQMKYNLPDKHLGKAVKCKSCNKAFKTKAPSKPGQAVALAKQTRKRPPAPAKNVPSVIKNQASADELAQLGIDGPLKAQPDIFSAAPPSGQDPLANHVVQDPGFRPTRRQKIDDGDDMFGGEGGEGVDEGFEDIFENSAVEQKKSAQRGVDINKRKKEDALLKSYMREDLFADDRPENKEPSEFTGFGRAWYFIGYLILAGIMIGVGVVISLLGYNPENLKPTPENRYTIAAIAVAILVFTGLVAGFLNYGRVLDFGFEGTTFALIAGIVFAVPNLISSVGLIISLIAQSPTPWTISGSIAGLIGIGQLPIGIAALVLPSDFAKIRKLDKASWIIIGLIPAFIILVIIVAVIVVVLS